MNRDDDLDELDDPALRAALRRALGRDGAPDHLRGRIELALAGAGPTLVPDYGRNWRASWDRWRDTVYASIAAAVFALGIGLVVLHYKGAFDGRPSQSYTLDKDLPGPIAEALVARHNACLALGHSPATGGGAPAARPVSTSSPSDKQLDAVASQLTLRLGFKVLAADPGAEWAFVGAGTCQVGSVKAGHFLFTRGNDALSIFALPASATIYKAPEDAQYAAMVRSQPIVAFKRGHGLYATVASSGDGCAIMSDVLTVRRMLQGGKGMSCPTTAQISAPQ